MSVYCHRYNVPPTKSKILSLLYWNTKYRKTKSFIYWYKSFRTYRYVAVCCLNLHRPAVLISVTVCVFIATVRYRLKFNGTVRYRLMFSATVRYRLMFSETVRYHFVTSHVHWMFPSTLTASSVMSIKRLYLRKISCTARRSYCMQLYGLHKLLYAVVRPAQVTVCSCTACTSYCMQLYGLHKLLCAAVRPAQVTVCSCTACR
jgi:hypothetical protein